MDLTQGGAHQNRLLLTEAEDVVLNTYLVIAELMQLYSENNKSELLERLTELQAKEPEIVNVVKQEKDKNTTSQGKDKK